MSDFQLLILSVLQKVIRLLNVLGLFSLKFVCYWNFNLVCFKFLVDLWEVITSLSWVKDYTFAEHVYCRSQATGHSIFLSKFTNDMNFCALCMRCTDFACLAWVGHVHMCEWSLAWACMAVGNATVRERSGTVILYNNTGILCMCVCVPVCLSAPPKMSRMGGRITTLLTPSWIASPGELHKLLF